MIRCSTALPYSHLNLRYNPFGQLNDIQTNQVARPRCDLSAVIGHLEQSKSAVQFIGRCGSGKTTHLRMICTQLPQFDYVHLPQGQKPVVNSATSLMVDEAQRLYWGQRSSLFPSANQIAIGTHRKLNRAFRAAGFDVWTISLDKPPGQKWLYDMLNDRILAARRCEGPIPRITDQRVLKLRRLFGNNIRGMQRDLYEVLQVMKTVQDI